MDIMIVISIVLLICAALSQVSSGTSTKHLYRMCQMGCKPYRKGGEERTMCREFTMACNALFRQDRILTDIEKELGVRQFSTSANYRGKKIISRKRKLRKSSGEDGMAAFAVGNSFAVATNGMKIIKVNGHNKPKVATYGSGIAVATDGKKTVVSSNGYKWKKSKKINNVSEDSDDYILEENEDESEKEADTIYKPLNKEMETKEIKPEDELQENINFPKIDHKKFMESVEAQNKKIMDDIMKKLNAQMANI